MDERKGKYGTSRPYYEMREAVPAYAKSVGAGVNTTTGELGLSLVLATTSGDHSFCLDVEAGRALLEGLTRCLERCDQMAKAGEN